MSEQHDQDDAVAGFSPAGMVVLVVDDDKLCLKVIAKMLSQCNYEGTRLIFAGFGSRLFEFGIPVSPALAFTQLFRACALERPDTSFAAPRISVNELMRRTACTLHQTRGSAVPQHQGIQDFCVRISNTLAGRANFQASQKVVLHM